jgi:hypothetical protein
MPTPAKRSFALNQKDSAELKQVQKETVDYAKTRRSDKQDLKSRYKGANFVSIGK